MKNMYFPDEDIDFDDLYYVCHMIEHVARDLHQRNKYVVNAIGEKEFVHLLSVAKSSHCENPLAVVDEWEKSYHLKRGDFDISDVDKSLVTEIPSATQMGKVYSRLIVNTASNDEDYAQGIVRVYNDPICEIIDNYNASAYYEPSYVQARAYFDGQF